MGSRTHCQALQVASRYGGQTAVEHYGGKLTSWQNYLVYTNSLLFMRCGGDSRVAGVMLAAGTFGIMVIGPVIIGYIPIMVVGALIFLLGIDLLREALADTWGRVSRLEYLTVCVPCTLEACHLGVLTG